MSPVSVSPHTLVLSSDSAIVTVDTAITNGSSVSEARAVTDSMAGCLSLFTYIPLGLSTGAVYEPVTGRSIIF